MFKTLRFHPLTTLPHKTQLTTQHQLALLAAMATPQPYRFVHGGFIPERPGAPPKIRLPAIRAPQTKEIAMWTVRTRTGAARSTSCEGPIKLALFGDGEQAPSALAQVLEVPAKEVMLAALKGERISGTGAMELAVACGSTHAPFRRSALDEFQVKVLLCTPSTMVHLC
jgi:hypothetical protein